MSNITLSQLQNNNRESQEYDNSAMVANNVLILSNQIKSLKEELDKNKEILLDYMVAKGIDKITDTDTNQSITYQEMTEKLIIDSKRLKSVYSEIYNDCVKVSSQKAHLVIK